MTRRISLNLAIALLVCAPLSAEAQTAVMVLPSGSSTVHALYTAGRDLLQRTGYTVDESLPDHESLPDQRIKVSVTYYDSASEGSSAIAKSTLSWLLEFRTESVAAKVVTNTADHRCACAGDRCPDRRIDR